MGAKEETAAPFERFFRPYGAFFLLYLDPRACDRGYPLPPLRGYKHVCAQVRLLTIGTPA